MSKQNVFNWQLPDSRGVAVGLILVVALIGFEIFNFDTTKYALLRLLGGLQFLTMEWAAILAFAFCGIDFAGLIRMFTPEQGLAEPKEVWLLMGAWLVGATMNAFMTWYAISVAILNRALAVPGVSEAEMQLYAPIFVAVLVWLTRILFIGSISVAADRFLHGRSSQTSSRQPVPARRARRYGNGRSTRQQANTTADFQENFFDEIE